MNTTVTAPSPNTETRVANDQGLAYRQPPHNVEAEKGLLGAIFTNNRAYEKVSEFLRPEHFWLPEHGRIFASCTRLIEVGQVADPVTLKTILEQDEGLGAIGGPKYLAELAGSAVTVINAGEYGRIVYDLHLKRELISLGEDVVIRAYGAHEDGAEASAPQLIEAAEQNLYDLATKGEYEGGFESFDQSLTKAMVMAAAAHKRDGALAGVTTGFIDLDALLGGLHPSDLLILAGRPSMGKTALATNIAYNAAYSHYRSKGEEGAVVGFFSLEMSSEQLATRIISEQVQISSDDIRKGKVGTAEFDRLAAIARELNTLPIFIDDTPALTVSALRTRARRLKRQHNLGLIVVDYLQLIAPPHGSRADGRVQEVSEITRGLKTLAKELNVPVIALSQLSRAVEQRDPPRPQLSDLRESGSIEQDSDVVMFIYREEYYIARKKPDISDPEKYAKWEERLERAQGLADIIVAKQRHGPIDDVAMKFEGKYTRFRDLDRVHNGYDQDPPHRG